MLPRKLEIPKFDMATQTEFQEIDEVIEENELLNFEEYMKNVQESEVYSRPTKQQLPTKQRKPKKDRNRD